DLDQARLRPLVAAVERAQPIGERVAAAARSMLGRPYVTNPLIGSAQSPEVFTASLAGFDCVTYVETALAAALSPSADGFADVLRADGELWLLNAARSKRGVVKQKLADFLAQNGMSGVIVARPVEPE